MPPTMMRKAADTERIRSYRHPGRRWLAIILALLSIISGVFLLSRDIDWETRRREAQQLGLAAEANGNYDAARQYYETALVNHPYDWESHLSLARILDHRMGDYDNALRHYYYALGYAPNPASMDDARDEIAILAMIRRGELENPWMAVEDLFLAVDANTEELFHMRLSRQLRDRMSDYWGGWRRRGRGLMVYCRVSNEKNGFFDASVELVFPDDTSMSMHFICVKSQVWRLELGFP